MISGRLSVGDLVAFIGYLRPARVADDGARLDAVDRAARARGDAAPERALRRAARDRQPARTRRRHRPFRGEIELRDVTFRYPGRAATDRRCSTTSTSRIPAGRTVAIVGRTGAGKSTLVQLLPRLFDVERGSVTARRARRAHAAARLAAAERRLRAAGPVPLLAHHPREHRASRATRTRRGAVRLGRAGRRPRARHRGHAARARHHRRRARHHALGRPEAARDAGARAREPIRASWSSTTRSRASTRRPSGRSWTGCAASSASAPPSSSRIASRP